MDTKAVLGFAAAIAIGGLMFHMGGFSSALDVNDPGLNSPSKFEDTAENSSLKKGANASVTNQGLGDIGALGLVLTALTRFFDAVAFVALLPWELDKLGLPWYGAYPLGLGGWYVMGIGLIQLFSRRPFH